MGGRNKGVDEYVHKRAIVVGRMSSPGRTLYR